MGGQIRIPGVTDMPRYVQDTPKMYLIIFLFFGILDTYGTREGHVLRDMRMTCFRKRETHHGGLE